MGNLKLYVGNLSYNVTEGELVKLFSTYGEVKNAAIVCHKDSGKSKGFAFVTMETPDAAQEAAYNLNKSMYDGREITVNEAREKEPTKSPTKRQFDSEYRPGTKKVYVGNLPFSIMENEIRDIFAEAGEVKSVKVITDQQTGRSKGFCFVEMATEEGAKKAVETLNEATTDGRVINVNSARPDERK